MSGKTGMTLYTALFDKKVKAMLKKGGLTMGDLLKDQMRMLVETLYKYTPPKTKKDGKMTATGDLARMFHGVDVDGALRAMHGIAQARGTYKGHPPERILVGTDMGKMAALHLNERGKRGRVYRSPRTYYVPMRALEKYKREVVKRVGRLKSGWHNAMRKLDSTKILKWAERAHGTTGNYGAASGNANIPADLKTLKRKTLTAWNNTAYIRDIDGMVKSAERVRLKDIKKHLPLRIEQMIARYKTA